MRLIIHAGMHKTGSSSIQATFAKLERPEIEYAPFKPANHSAIFEHMTNTSPEHYHGFKNSGMKLSQIVEESKALTKDFNRFLRRLQGTGIFSAEDISSPRKGDQVERLGEIVHKFDLPVDVLVYVRPPHSFMESSFQQMVKAGERSKLDPSSLWPRYRACIHNLDKVFGKENVTVRPFHPWEFPNSDVVEDFAEFVGIKLEPGEIRRANEALSAEAIALLFIQRKFGHGLEKPGKRIPRRNNLWAAKLNTLGTQKLRFADSLVEPVIEANREDMDWIEKRIGRKLEDRRSSSSPAFVVEDERQLIRLGIQQLRPLEELLRQTIDEIETKNRDRAVQLLESLRALC